MLYGPQNQLWLVNLLIAEDIRRADEARRFQRSKPSIRRAIGARIVRVGARLAGEPADELVWSR